MSQNQSRAEKTEGHLRKPGRSGSLGQNRGFSGSGKGGGGGSAPAAALFSSAAPPPSELSTTRSFKKSGNGQGGQSRANSGNSSSDAAPGAVQNGAYSMSPSDGPSLGLESGSAKAVDSTNNKKISRAVPKAPASLSAAAPPGDESGPFLQFGTINPGIMNGMQVPARTCSAPPNLDEQKRNQIRHDSFRVSPAPHIPSVPKPQQPMPQPLLQQKQPQTMKDAIRQADNRESHPPTHAKRDVHAPIPSTSTATSARSSVLPVGGMPIHVPFQQPQIPVQFSGPNLQMPSQGIVSNSLQMTMTLPSGNVPQVPQPMFVPNIQSHPLQPQAIMHQGQNLGFAPQLGHQLPPQLGSMGIGIAPQFSQQQPGNFVSQRRAVKITHPETHEELKLDKRPDSHADAGTSGQRQLPNAISQSQSFPTFNHQISYYPTTYNPSPMFFPSPSSLPLTSAQMTTGSQAARYSYPVGQNGQTISFMNPSLNPATGGRPVPPPPLHGLPEAVNLEGSLVSPSLAAPAQVTVKPAILSSSERVGTPLVRISMPITKPESPKISKLPGDIPVTPLQKDKEISLQDTAMMQNKDYEPPEIGSSSSASNKNLKIVSSMITTSTSNCEISSLAPTSIGDTFVTENDGRKKETLKKSESLKDHQKRSSKMELKHSQQEKDALDDTGIMSSQHAQSVKDHYMTDTEHSVSKDSVSGHSAVEADSFASATSFPSINRESKAFELDRKKDSLGASGPSRATLEEEQSEGACSNCSDIMGVAGDRLSFVETVHLEASTSSITDVDGIRLGISGSSLDVWKALEVGQKLEKSAGLGCRRDEVSDGDLLGSSSAGAYPVSSSIGHLNETTEKVKLEVVEESSERKTTCELCDSDNLQFGSLEEGGSYISGLERTTAESDVPTTIFSHVKDAEPVLSGHASFTNVDEGKISFTDSTISKCEITYPEDFSACEPGIQLSEMDPMPSVSKINQNLEIKDVELSNGIKIPSVLSVPQDKPSLETTRTRTNKKKKRKEILSKADAVGSSDLYNAYKGPEEKQETASTSEIIENSLAAESKNDTVEDRNNAYVAVEQDEQCKAEIEDWEDAADASTSTLRTSETGEQINLEKEINVNYGNESIGKKKYSRDFLLTLSEQCKDLPEGFEIGSDITDILTSVPAGLARGIDRDMIASPGRIIDRSPGASRGDRRMAGISDDDRWTKVSNTFRMDLGHGVAAMNFRPGQGINHGVLRNPRGQSPNLLSGGILSGPMQSLASQGGITRNNSDADRWQRATGTQRGLMPPPQGPMQVMHKSANRYEVGKVSDEEEQKQRRLKAILNKLTPQNFDKLFAQVKEVNIDNTLTLTGVISQIFDKALMEPTFCEMYADFCLHLASELPDFSEHNERITFRRLLLNKCQEEFERGEREQAEADKAEEEGEIHQTEEEREEKRIKARRRMLGNIRLIGELYKKKMLTERIMHECIKKLLGQYQNPDEENIEALCKLMSTIGEMIDHPKAREHMDTYFEMMAKLSTNQRLSSRVRFMLKDTIDLRRNRWQQRRKVEGPKKIEDVHRDAAQERHAQTSRSARGPIIPSRRGPPVDYGHRGTSILNSTSSQLSGSLRGLPGHIRDSASQDVRLDDRHQFESRVPSVPLPQRPTDDGSITLGPQGGLARGMSGRGQGLISNAPLHELSPRINDSHRLASGPNGFSSNSDRIPPISREESIPKFMTDRSSGPTNDQTSFQERNSVFGIRDSRLADHALDKSSVATSGRRPGSSGGKIISSSESKALSDEILQEKSISAIREFYSAKDEKEVVYCIRDLNAPSFYSSMVSLWVIDSFERKNIERTLLAQLLVSLSKGHDSLINRAQLIEGFQSVLYSLEDAVNDAPKAAEFLGHIFGKVVVENVLPLREIGKLIREGGELPGALLKAGLGSEVLGNILEFVKMEKGDSFLNEIRTSSNLRLEDFMPFYPSAKSKKLDAFL